MFNNMKLTLALKKFLDILLISNALDQIMISSAGLFLAYLVYVLLKIALRGWLLQSPVIKSFNHKVHPILLPAWVAGVQWTLIAAAREFGWGDLILQLVAKCATAWFAARCLSLLRIRREFRKLAAFVIYVLAFLAILGLLPHLIQMMEGAALNVGDLHLSLLSTVKGVTLFLALMWGTLKASNKIEQTFTRRGNIDRSHRELFTKLIKVGLVTFSVLLSLSLSGINLSAFTVFGGAIGVGIGFGLQKIVSNFICGLILHLDRSIKPGDVITLDQGRSYGEINKLGARCVSVRTRSGKEHLIPNEEFITNRSINWSYTDRFVRLGIPMRAGLDSDVNQVLGLLVEATQNVDRIVHEKPPGARLRAFTDSAIEFELRVWIQDPENGVSKVISDVYVQIWELFKEHNITIPHIQSDLHVRGIEANTTLKPQSSALHEVLA